MPKFAPKQQLPVSWQNIKIKTVDRLLQGFKLSTIPKTGNKEQIKDSMLLDNLERGTLCLAIFNVSYRMDHRGKSFVRTGHICLLEDFAFWHKDFVVSGLRSNHNWNKLNSIESKDSANFCKGFFSAIRFHISEQNYDQMQLPGTNSKVLLPCCTPPPVLEAPLLDHRQCQTAYWQHLNKTGHTHMHTVVIHLRVAVLSCSKAKKCKRNTSKAFRFTTCYRIFFFFFII